MTLSLKSATSGQASRTGNPQSQGWRGLVRCLKFHEADTIGMTDAACFAASVGGVEDVTFMNALVVATWL